MMREKIFELVKRAVELSGREGLNPTAAVQKVAEEHNLNQDFIDRVVAAYNTARTVHIFDHYPDRTVKFALADPAQVVAAQIQSRIEQIARPKPIIEKISDHHLFDPEFDFESEETLKIASEESLPKTEGLPAPCTIFNPILGELKKIAHRLEESQLIFDDLVEGFFDSLTKIGEAVSPRISSDGLGDDLDLQRLESQAIAKFGKEFATIAFDWIAKKANYQGLRATQPDSKRMILWADPQIGQKLEESHQIFQSLVKLGRVYDEDQMELKKATDEFHQLFKQAKTLYGVSLVPDELNQDTISQPSVESNSKPISYKREPFSDALDIFSSTLQEGNKFINADQLKQLLADQSARDEAKKLTEVYENTQRQIILQKLISQDPVLSKEDPDAVAQAYQALMQISPRVSLNENLARSILRAMAAQQALGPFEAEQITRLEANLRRQMEPLQVEQKGRS